MSDVDWKRMFVILNIIDEDDMTYIHFHGVFNDEETAKYSLLSLLDEHSKKDQFVTCSHLEHFDTYNDNVPVKTQRLSGISEVWLVCEYE